MIEKKYFFIINPIAGNGRGLAAWKKIRKTLQEQGISYTHKYTFPNQESNQEMILNTVDKNHIIVVLGGDGTINEILNKPKIIGNIVINILIVFIFIFLLIKYTIN